MNIFMVIHDMVWRINYSPSEFNQAITSSHLLFPQPCVLVYESLNHITHVSVKCDVTSMLQLILPCWYKSQKPKALNLFVSIIAWISSVFILILNRETLQLIFSTLVLVKNPIRPVSFEVETEEWRGLWKKYRKRKKFHCMTMCNYCPFSLFSSKHYGIIWALHAMRTCSIQSQAHLSMQSWSLELTLILRYWEKC